MTFTARLLTLTLRLAALTHDIGKMTDAFQQKLWQSCKSASGPKAEFIRHDAMSYRLLRGLGWRYEALDELPCLTPVSLAETVSARTAAELRDAFDAALREDLNRLRLVLAPNRSKRTKPAPPLSLEELVCRISAFLSLTHHRLPGPSRRGHQTGLTYDRSLSAETYFNPAEAYNFAACVHFSGGNVFAHAELHRALSETLLELDALTTDAPSDLDQDAFLRLALTYGRPILVFADYLASGLKSGEPVATGDLLANTIRSPNDTLPARPGDSLSTHILSVYSHVQRHASVALSLSSNQRSPLPDLSAQATNDISAKLSRKGKFAWQAELHDHLASRANGTPSFVAVTAGTGSGKTIASAQVMCALGSARWTYCLGLRSLTLQTGRSYQDDLGLTNADLAVVIGDQVARKAFESEAVSRNEVAGSESLAQEPIAALHSGAQQENWLQLISEEHTLAALNAVFSERKLDFLAAPVVVCTVDQLIGVTHLSSVTKAFDYKRLQSADLVLDEVDNYSPDELKHIARLCFLVGLARKNIVCLSATMGPLHVEALLSAWRHGIQLNHQLTALGADVLFTTAANTNQPASLVLTGGMSLTRALAHNEQFNAATIAQGNAIPPKALLTRLECKATDHHAVLEEAVRLHGMNASDVDGCRVSAGFIRMNTVGSARNLAKFLLAETELPNDTELAVVCYHSRYTGLEMTLIDRALNQVTNRKHLVAGEAFSTEALTNYVRPILRSAGKSNLLIIAVTTSIIETGRDHDYDWAILEPSSHRSLVQAAGRVRRHRDASPTRTQNVAVIAYPARACSADGYVPRDPVNVFSFPGPLTALAEKKFHDRHIPYAELLERANSELGVPHALRPDVVRDACADGFMTAYPDGARNAIALTPTRELTNNLAILEQYVLFKAMTEPATLDVLNLRLEAVSAAAQQEKALWLTSWAYRSSFREDSNAFIEDQVYLMREHNLRAGNYATNEPLTRAGTKAASLVLDDVKPAHPFRSLLTGGAGGARTLRELLTEEASALASCGFTRSDLLDFSCYSPERRGLVPDRIHYNPLIGFNNKAAE